MNKPFRVAAHRQSRLLERTRERELPGFCSTPPFRTAATVMKTLTVFFKTSPTLSPLFPTLLITHFQFMYFKHFFVSERKIIQAQF